MPDRATLYVPWGLDLLRWVARLEADADRRGWRADSLVRDWAELVALLATGQADIGLMWSRVHLPPGRRPRLEFAEEWPLTGGPRRPTIRRR